MAVIHLVRHGQASFGAANYDALSPLGVEQSRILGEFASRAGLPVDRVICGPAMRHAQTAAAFLDGRGFVISPTVEAGFAEFDHMHILDRYRPGCGDVATLAAELAREADPRRAFEGMFRAAIARWVDARNAHDYSETYHAFTTRCEDAFARVCALAGHAEAVWVFTSGGPISAVIRKVLSLSDTQTWEVNSSIVNASMTTLKTRGDRARLESFNSYSHLHVDASGRLVTHR